MFENLKKYENFSNIFYLKIVNLFEEKTTAAREGGTRFSDSNEAGCEEGMKLPLKYCALQFNYIIWFMLPPHFQQEFTV